MGKYFLVATERGQFRGDSAFCAMCHHARPVGGVDWLSKAFLGSHDGGLNFGCYMFRGANGGSLQYGADGELVSWDYSNAAYVAGMSSL